MLRRKVGSQVARYRVEGRRTEEHTRNKKAENARGKEINVKEGSRQFWGWGEYHEGL